ncbi:MAG: acetylglutamate kinase [bacterium]|nr:acetylglutamate kinase [bacterium]
MLLIKIGGGTSLNLSGIANDIAALVEPTVIVHGANGIRNQLAEQLGIKIQTVTSVSGTSSVLSDESVVELAMMAYAGLANKRLVALLQQRGVNALGLSGLDGQVVTARRNPGIRVRSGTKKILLRDQSGRADDVNVDLLNLLIENGYTPVLTMPLIDQNGFAVNSENDDVIAAIHRRMIASKIVFLIEEAGLLEDPRDPSSVLPRLTLRDVADRELEAQGRMARKLRSIRKMLEATPTAITIADGRSAHPLSDALEGKGTVIQ